MAKNKILPISFEWSQKIGVRDQPEFNARHETNVPGIYVVGDLADAPIIKVALNQGHDVAKQIAGELGQPAADDELLDVVVIGAGPGGIGAALALQETSLRFVVLEKERPFDTIQNFPKAKLIFSEPLSVQSRANFWFEDAVKEDLIDRWERALDDHRLPIRQPEEVVDVQRQAHGFSVETVVGRGGLEAATPGGAPQRPAGVSTDEGARNSYRCRVVILAIGRRGAIRKLDIPGAELDKVAYALRDPEDYRGRRLLVVGGGDSAVEAAASCADAGAEVTLSYRGEVFSRAKAGNRQRIEELIEAGRVRAEMATNPVEIRPDTVVLERGEQRVELENDDVLVFIGTKLPHGFMKRIGLRMAGTMDVLRASWVVSFAALTYCFYVLKHGKQFWPFGPDDVLGSVPAALKVQLPFREGTVGPSFWGTCVYSLLILSFGIRAYRKYPRPEQKRRYLSLIVFQWVFLFGIPEVIAPAVIKAGHVLPELLSRPWKFYAISVPWPLSIWSVLDGPGWGGIEHASTAVIWIVLGLLIAFVAVPLYVRRNGQRFCSYMCGCGGLAETLGDFWRHLAPRGLTSYKAEWFGRAILILAVPVTLLLLNDAWKLVASGALYSTTQFAREWYGLMVDFWLASVIGVAFYPYLGNRVWCRFFCPLRAWMELIARRVSRITIKSNDKCIGCGECTRYCQMGIQVQKFAQQRVDLDNSNSSCIQCGICVQVCPMEVLSVERNRDLAGEKKAPPMAPATGPRS